MIETVENELPETAKQASSAIENVINGNLQVLELLSQNEKLSNARVPMKEKLSILSQEAKRSKHTKMTISDAKGNSENTLGQKQNLTDREYFKQAIAGKSNVSDPIINKSDGSIIVIYSVPIKKDGKIVGVLTASRDGNEISNYTNSIKFGKTGQAFMINKNGTTIAHNNKDLVLKQDNNFENIKKDSELSSLVDIEKKMVLAESGAGDYSYKGKDKYIGYAPVKSTGWSIGIVINTDEILSELNALKIGIGVTTVVFILIGGVIVFLLSKTITKPISASMNHLQVISEGNLTEEIEKELLDRKDELGKMAKAIDVMRKTMGYIVKDIKISSSNINDQADNLASVSDEMESSSKNIYIATNDAAKGTEHQAQELVDITNILQEFNLKLDNMVKVIKNVDSSTNDIKTMADSSNTYMENVIKSVENVNTAFKELIAKIQGVGENINKINAITDLINNISEQTNLLALNAAIEAARAGEVGKGFSVVADEIRKLAEQSKESSINISNLISEISKDTNAMVNTTDIMKEELENQGKEIYTAMKSFETITEAVDNIAPKMVAATNSIEDLNSNKEIIITKIETSSSVAEEVSASAEEIAASTEEMNKPSGNLAKSLQLLNDMSKNMMGNVNKFKVEN
ncbi:methyl-accepting chemotaxis protein [Clostridium sp. Marseille-Q2269]|uniref:methyl-accepting chemotaxis protein n=1 Tax=Clostridium sp. Marseille-Q2269 TaxID=2942205 RepID=UPI00207401B1|nr:methyl-accepting chemotaxis protein [Clostridium sp. Marseille-Q2269]